MNFGRIGKIVLLAAGAIAGAAAMTACQKEDDELKPRGEQDDGARQIFKAQPAQNTTASQVSSVEDILRNSTQNSTTLELENRYSVPSIASQDTIIHVPETADQFEDMNWNNGLKAYGQTQDEAEYRLANKNTTGRWVYKMMNGDEFRSLGLTARIDSQITNTEKLNTPKVFSNLTDDKHLVMIRYSMDPTEEQPAWVKDAINNKGFYDVSGGAGNLSQAVTQLVGNINIDASTHVVVDFKDLEKILGDIRTLLGDFITQYGVDMEKIKEYLKKFSNDFDSLNATQQAIYKLLQRLKADVVQGNEENANFHKKILHLMVKYGEENNADHKKIIKLLEKIADMTGANRNILNKIMDLIQNLPDHDYSVVLDKILKAIQDNTGAINTLNANQQAGFAAVLAAFAEQPDYSAKLDEIIKQLKDANGNISSYGQQILAKLGQMQVSIENIDASTGDIRTISGQIKTILENMEFPQGSGPTTVNVDLSVLEATTQAILDKLDDLIPPDYRNLLEQILAKIPTKIGCDCNCDCDAIIDLLTRILGALQSGYNEGTGGFQQEINEI